MRLLRGGIADSRRASQRLSRYHPCMDRSDAALVWGPRAGEKLVLVDSGDREVGTATRAECHTAPGLRHRAFSVYLFDSDDRLLVQRRQDSKPLWPGRWSNSCCSHPIAGEDVAAAAVRRTSEELGFGAQLSTIGHYEYRAEWRDVGVEHEVVHLFLGAVDPGAVEVDPDEVAGLCYLTCAELDATIAEDATYTPWFQAAWPRVRSAWLDR